MGVTITVLCENSVERVSPAGLLGEHGFACHLATPYGKFLFDTGSGLSLLHNARRLGVDLSDLQGIIISHGHYDHTGGLEQVLQETGPVPIYAHPDLFTRRFSSLDGESRQIGLPWQQAELEQMGAVFEFSRNAREIVPGMILSGEIPRLSAAETGDPRLMAYSEQGAQVSDPLYDDQSLFIHSEQGLVILLGCAHAGLINIINHAAAVTEQTKFYMVLGGTHLKFCSEQQMMATVHRLAEANVKRIGAAHCTGLRGAYVLAESFGDRFFSASVGTTVTL